MNRACGEEVTEIEEYALMLTLATTQTDNAQKTHGAGFLAVSKAQLLTEHHHPSPTAV